MTFASLLNERTIKTLSNMGAGIIAFLVLAFLFYDQLAYQTSKIEAIGPEMETIKSQHHQMMSESEKLKEELIREARKQTILQQKNCVRLSTSRQEANDCLLFEL
jgi:hypothetical protein